MVAKVQKSSNCKGLRLAKGLRNDGEIEAGGAMGVAVRDGALAATLVHRVRGKIDLKDLVARTPEDHKPEELDWGPPVGGEVW